MATPAIDSSTSAAIAALQKLQADSDAMTKASSGFQVHVGANNAVSQAASTAGRSGQTG
jgi:hypothetical protein